MNTLNFNDADLKANREGRLSDAQRKRLDTEIDQVRKQARVSIQLWLGFFAFLTACSLLSTNSYHTLLSHLTGPGFTIITAFFFVMVLLTVIQYSWDTRRLLKSQIRCVDGRVKVMAQAVHPWQSQSCYDLVVYRNWYLSLVFRLKDSASVSYFENGMCYRLYYVKITASTLLLSAEEIEPEKARH